MPKTRTGSSLFDLGVYVGICEVCPKDCRILLGNQDGWKKCPFWSGREDLVGMGRGKGRGKGTGKGRGKGTGKGRGIREEEVRYKVTREPAGVRDLRRKADPGHFPVFLYE